MLVVKIEMGLLVMTNPQLGSCFCLETTKLTSSSSCGFASNTNMNANKKRSGRVFVMRKEESEKRLVLEKELEFKPSFNEYLKALDSVKTARDTLPKPPHDKPTTYSSNDGLKENVKLSKFDEKGSVVSKSRDAKVKRVFRGETSNGRSLLYHRDSGVEPKLKDKGETFRNASRGGPFRRSNTSTSVDTRGKLVYDQNSSNMAGFGAKGNGSFEREKVGVRSWGRGAHGGATPERNLVPVQKDTNENEIELRSGNLVSSNEWFRRKSGDDDSRGAHGGATPERNLVLVQKDTNENEIEPRSGNLVSSSKWLRRKSGDDDSSWEVERAAFNSLEEDNDIMDKPRVSKMEMEERIQNLARRLNGADINVPEWIFSKTMRSARIRFSDHSILRVIQILGKLGNWRRVLQVIEWLQRRERYKSHRLSGDSSGRTLW